MPDRVVREQVAAAERVVARVWWLILGRVALAVVFLLFTSAVWRGGDLTSVEQGALPIFIAVVALSVVYALALRLLNNLAWQLRLQMFCDVLLITWLVWVTGGAVSPFTALYIVSVALAGFFLGARGALGAALLCVVSYTALSLGMLLGFVPPYKNSVARGFDATMLQTVGLNGLAILVVGLLASRLARQAVSDVRLQETAKSLATLRALHERIVESIRSGVVTTDLPGRIFTFNAAAEEITGYTAEDVRGQEASIFFGELDDKVKTSLDAAARGAASPRFEADCLTSEGLRLRLGFTISPLFDEDNEQTGLVITFQDLTDMRALEEMSRRQDRMAAVGRMAASIAHEIRNPLAAMRGSVQVLQGDFAAGSSQAELMGIVLRESDRLNKIVTDFLTYARPRSSARAEVDLAELLRETLVLLRHSPEVLPAHQITEDYPAESLTTNADAAQLKQVFWNIARNALQAMPDGGTLAVTLSANAQNRRRRIEFADTGAGMTQEQVERLFEPFTSTKGSTGLGLSIVYQIVRDHGGAVTARSREGQGATFTIELPPA